MAAPRGQVAVDLPDPLDKLDDETAAGADDLLRQLAGDEIDRMLGDAPASSPAPPASPATVPAALTPPAPATSPAEPFQDELDTLFQELNAAEMPDVHEMPATEPVVATPTSAAAKLEPTPVDPNTEAALDALFSELSTAKMPAADEPAASVPAADVTADAIADAKPALPPDELEEAVVASTTPAAQGHDAAGEIGAELAEAVAAHDEQEALDRGDRLAWYFRPLLWMNAPFRSLGDGVREAVGTVGIITTANALAVLLYVMLFR